MLFQPADQPVEQRIEPRDVLQLSRAGGQVFSPSLGQQADGAEKIPHHPVVAPQQDFPLRPQHPLGQLGELVQVGKVFVIKGVPGVNVNRVVFLSCGLEVVFDAHLGDRARRASRPGLLVPGTLNESDDVRVFLDDVHRPHGRERKSKLREHTQPPAAAQHPAARPLGRFPHHQPLLQVVGHPDRIGHTRFRRLGSAEAPGGPIKAAAGVALVERAEGWDALAHHRPAVELVDVLALLD